jgi:hypothetical protein
MIETREPRAVRRKWTTWQRAGSSRSSWCPFRWPMGFPTHEEWRWNSSDSRMRFVPPRLPEALRDLVVRGDAKQIPAAADFSGAMKSFASPYARRQQRRFTWAAAIIILTHILRRSLRCAAHASHRVSGR